MPKPKSQPARARARHERRANMRAVVYVRAATDDTVSRCERCGRVLGWHEGTLQHRRAGGMGGSSDPVAESPANGVWACPECHLGHMEGRSEEAYWDGWVVRQGVDPR